MRFVKGFLRFIGVVCLAIEHAVSFAQFFIAFNLVFLMLLYISSPFAYIYLAFQMYFNELYPMSLVNIMLFQSQTLYLSSIRHIFYDIFPTSPQHYPY